MSAGYPYSIYVRLTQLKKLGLVFVIFIKEIVKMLLHLSCTTAQAVGCWRLRYIPRFRVISAHNKIGPCQFRPMTISAKSNFGP